MAKIDQTLSDITSGFQNPQTALYQTVVDSNQMPALNLRRKGDAAQYKIWCLAIGEFGQNPTVAFYGHKPSECLKRGLEWRGLPTKKTRGPRKQAAQPEATT